MKKIEIIFIHVLTTLAVLLVMVFTGLCALCMYWSHPTLTTITEAGILIGMIIIIVSEIIETINDLKIKD